jgi:hypothetical protein
LGQTSLTSASTSFVPSFSRLDTALPVSGSRVWVGPEWLVGSAPFTYICADQSGASTQPGYRSQSTNAPNENLSVVFPSYRHLGVRAEFAPAGACIPSDTAMCLQNGRFKVEATFQVTGQAVGTAHAVKLTSDTGYLWFFQETNVEAVVKVLDACTFNQKFWVFAGGLTNVLVNLTITDTMNGTAKTYTNPQGKSFQPVQDTSAFATCP